MAKIVEKDDNLNASLKSRVKPTSRPGVEGEPELNKASTQNPFPMGPNTEFQQPGRAMKQMITKPKEAFQSSQSGTMIVDTLLKFAGTAGKVYELEANKKIESDRIIQTSRAVQSLSPTDDATVAGYTAHATVAIGNYTNQAAAEMNEFSKQGVSDEVWEEKTKQVYSEIDKRMSAEYNNYNTMPELKELTATALSEKMLEMSASREIQKIDIEIDKRMNTATDSVILAINQPGKDTNGTIEGMGRVMKVLKLSPDQMDKVVLNSIKSVGTLEALEIAKAYTGVGRKTSLYERAPELQNLEKKLTKKGKDEISFDHAHAVKNAEEEYIKEGNEAKFITTAKALGLSQGSVNAVLGKRDKAVYEQNRIAKISVDAADPTRHFDPTATSDEIQLTFEDQLQSNTRLHEQRLGADKMPDGPDKTKALAESKANAIRQTTNNALAKGVVIKSFVSELEKLADTDFAALNTQYINNEGGRKTALSFENTPQSFKDAYNAYKAMSPAAQQQYLLAMDQGKADVVREAEDLINSGVDTAEAFRKGQIDSRIPKSYKTKEVKKAVGEVIDEVGRGLFVPDIPKHQKDYVSELVRGELSRSQNPSSESNIKRVADSFKKDHTLSDGILYKGRQEVLNQLTKLNNDKLTDAFNLIKSSPGIADRLKRASETYRFNVDDVFAVTNPGTGTYHFRSPDGSYVSDEYDLGELKDKYNEEKVAAAEMADKIQEDRNRKTQEEKKRFDRYNSLTEEAKPINTLDKDSWVDRLLSKGNKGRKKQEEAREKKKIEEDDKYLNNHKQRAGISLK